MRNLTYGFDIYLVHVKTIRQIAQIFVAFSEKLNFNIDLIYSSIKTNRGSGSGGFTENLFIAAAKELFGEDVNDVEYKILKNSDFQELSLSQDGQVKLCFAIANGFRNIQNLVQKMKRKRCNYDFVEVMACPSGCLNGGAQVNSPFLGFSRDVRN